ncbi:unnamed protein product [Amoebophrya sp. A25]|nr:unnamed protein product [Amoebophrya sp. A25]|eukprot:GSA25T00002169001.1
MLVHPPPYCLWILNKNGTLIFHHEFQTTRFTANDRIRLASTLHGISVISDNLGSTVAANPKCVAPDPSPPCRNEEHVGCLPLTPATNNGSGVPSQLPSDDAILSCPWQPATPQAHATAGQKLYRIPRGLHSFLPGNLTNLVGAELPGAVTLASLSSLREMPGRVAANAGVKSRGLEIYESAKPVVRAQESEGISTELEEVGGGSSSASCGYSQHQLRQISQKHQEENLAAHRRHCKVGSESTKPEGLRACLRPRGLRRIQGEDFQIYMRQSLSHIRFILITDSTHDSRRAQEYLDKFYAAFSAYVMQDPFQVSLDLPVNSELFEHTIRKIVMQASSDE